jgi:NAD(P)H-hydrate epimerase
MKLATAAEMQQLDRLAIEEYGIPGIVLMENAGHGTVSLLEDELGSLLGKTVVIFVGPGNNGGDGLVIARRVYQAHGHPLLFFATPPEKLKGDAATNYSIVQKLGLPCFNLDKPLHPENITKILLQQHGKFPVSCLVDSLFGTGLARDITGHIAQVIDLINTLRTEYCWPVVAVDLPSGLEADTGQVLGIAVQADFTATYGLAKPAHYHNGGAGIGKLDIVDIGIPRVAVQHSKLHGEGITCINKKKFPQRLTASHKGSHGHLLVLAGSIGKTGAALLCCRAALHSGCGLITAAVPSALNPVFEQNLIEAMTLPLSGSETCLSIQDVEAIISSAQGKTAVVLGPGIGTDNETRHLVQRLYQELSHPMVVDADALNILASQRDILENPGGPRILTPHPGEMSRLTDLSTKDIQADRITAAVSLCKKNNQKIFTVLKGAGTIIAYHEKWAINTSGNHGMAAGGMGDVLAGLIGSLLAQGSSPWNAACSGVYLHGLAADILACKSSYGYLASEVASTLPQAIQCSLNAEGA